MKNIALVGFMGTGKSTIGRLLSEKLQAAFVDIDEVIEEKEGMKIADIFLQIGEDYFRKVEKNIVMETFRVRGRVIACGGGVVLDDENVRAIRKNGFMIALEASPEVILMRTAKYKHRPLLNVPDPKSKINELLIKRKPFYAKSDWTIDTSRLREQEVVEAILNWLEAKK